MENYDSSQPLWQACCASHSTTNQHRPCSIKLVRAGGCVEISNHNIQGLSMTGPVKDSFEHPKKKR